MPAMTQQPALPPYAWEASRSHSPRTLPSICIPPRAPGGLPSRTPSTPLLTRSKPEVFCDKQVANLRVLREDVECWCVVCVVCVVQMMKNAPCLARVAPEMHLIGWQNTWEQAPGVPATPSPP